MRRQRVIDEGEQEVQVDTTTNLHPGSYESSFSLKHALVASRNLEEPRNLRGFEGHREKEVGGEATVITWVAPGQAKHRQYRMTGQRFED